MVAYISLRSGRSPILQLLLINHDVPLISAVSHAGDLGGPSAHLLLSNTDWQCHCQQQEGEGLRREKNGPLPTSEENTGISLFHEEVYLRKNIYMTRISHTWIHKDGRFGWNIWRNCGRFPAWLKLWGSRLQADGESLSGGLVVEGLLITGIKELILVPKLFQVSNPEMHQVFCFQLLNAESVRKPCRRPVTLCIHEWWWGLFGFYPGLNFWNGRGA